MWPASLTRAREPDHQPAATSTPAKPSVRAVASMSLRPLGGLLDLLLGRISHHLGMSEFNQCREERLALEM